MRINRFIADCHLGKLAKYLRLFGFDTYYYNRIEDDELIRIAMEEDRVILTRDKELSVRSGSYGYYLQPLETRRQLTELIASFDLARQCRPFSRCLVCNTLLEAVDKETVALQIPPKVLNRFDRFDYCPGCGKVFWHGDHYKRMCGFVDAVLRETAENV